MVKNKYEEPGFNPHVSVDCVVFGFDGIGLNVLLIERDYGKEDIDGKAASDWLLPGDLIRDDEDLDAAANRVLSELTHLDNIYLQQFHAFGNPDRVRKKSDSAWLRSVRGNPDARVVTIGYYSLVRQKDYTPTADSFARKTAWHPVTDIPELGFDHNLIFETALMALQTSVQSKAVGYELLPEKFTLSQIQKLYEAIFQQSLDKRNFRRKILSRGFLLAQDEKQTDVPHKRAQLFRFDKEKYGQYIPEDFRFF